MSSLPLVPLGSLMASATGSVNPAAYPDETFELYSIPAFDLREPAIVRGREVGSSKQVVRPNDVLLSKIVPHIRRSWVVGPDRGRRLIASGEWIVFRSDRVHPAYLRQVLVSDPFHAQFMSTVSGVGGSLLRARPAHVANLQIPLPSLPEQRRIAEVLDLADALRAKRRAGVARLDSLTQSIFLDMFDGLQLSAGRPLSAAFSEPPCFGSMIPPSETGAWLAVRVGNIQNSRLDLSDSKYIDLPPASVARHSVREGDVLMARAIASLDHLGKSVVAHPGPDRWAFDSHLMRIRLDDSILLPDFLQLWLLTPNGRRTFLRVARRSSVQFNVNTKEIAVLPVPMPPVDKQRRFVCFLASVERQRTTVSSSLAQLDTLFASLQHRAFRGEL